MKLEQPIGETLAGICTISLMLSGFLSGNLLSGYDLHGGGISSFTTSVIGKHGLGAPGLFGKYFIENRGQVEGEIRYYLTGNPSAGIRDDGVMFVFKGPIPDAMNQHHLPENLIASGGKEIAYAYLLQFDNANTVIPIARGLLPSRSNFLVGGDPGKWRTDVPNYREVTYRNLYDGIDLIYTPASNGVKYEFIVRPGADPASIIMRYVGVESLILDTTGLTVSTPLGFIRDSLPHSYQETGEEVKCGFVIRDISAYGFNCEGRDSRKTLVIDPLINSTFLGGSSIDSGGSIALDTSENVYLTGWTNSTDFPVSPGAYDTSHNGGNDVFIAKLNAAGDALVYSTFLGGSNDDQGFSIAVDLNGNAYITGVTLSGDFPVTPGAYNSTYGGGQDAFVTKLNAAGDSLVYSTFLGGSRDDDGFDIAVDSSGSAYITGWTNSTDFSASPGAYDTSYNGVHDVFITKLTAAGNALDFSTFVGGSDDEDGESIALGTDGDAYVTGKTTSADFPVTPGAFDIAHNNNTDAFLIKLNATGNALVYSTFLGGSNFDWGRSIAVDRQGDAYVAGASSSLDFPTTMWAYKSLYGGPGYDVFVTKLNGNGSALVYSTFIGSGAGNSIALDSNRNVYLTGTTTSSTFPTTPDAFDTSLDGLRDAFVTRLNATGSRLVYSTFLGGSSHEWGTSIAVDLTSIAYVTGETWSADFPVTPGAFETAYNGGQRDAFITKLYPFGPDLAVSPGDIAFQPPGPVTAGTSVTINATVHNLGGNNASSVVVRFYDGQPFMSSQIGTDQTIPFILPMGGKGNISVVWIASTSGSHDICVFADPNDLIIEESETNNIACGNIDVDFYLKLTPGHRLMSFPLAMSNESIESVLSSIAGCFDYVRWYDPLDSSDHWKSYMPGRSYNDLTHLNNKMGLWINITADCTFTPVGVMPVSTMIDLHQGWNMIGFPSFNSTYAVADLKADIGMAGVVVEAFDANAAPYYLQRASDGYVMKAGEGYWVYVPSDATWTVNG